MYTVFIYLKSGNVVDLDYYGMNVAIECGHDHLRCPDVEGFKVTNKRTGELIVEHHKGE